LTYAKAASLCHDVSSVLTNVALWLLKRLNGGVWATAVSLLVFLLMKAKDGA